MTKIDSTKVIIVSDELKRLVEVMSHQPTGLSSGEIALIAATIGALAALSSQLLIFILNRFKDKSNLKKELVAEERRISYLLSEYYKELVMFKVHKQYYYKAAELVIALPDQEKEQYIKSTSSNQKAIEALTKIRITMSEYIKTLTHFTNLVGVNKIISLEIEYIKAFEPRNASKFAEIKDLDSLVAAEKKEEDDLNLVYKFYSDCFDRINIQMSKKI